MAKKTASDNLRIVFGSEEFRKAAIDAMQKIAADNSNTIIRKHRIYRDSSLMVADDTCESVKYIVKAKNGKRIFCISKIYKQGLGTYEFAVKIKRRSLDTDMPGLYNL